MVYFFFNFYLINFPKTYILKNIGGATIIVKHIKENAEKNILSVYLINNCFIIVQYLQQLLIFFQFFSIT